MREERMSGHGCSGAAGGRIEVVAGCGAGAGSSGQVVIEDNSTTWEEVKKAFYFMCLRKRPAGSRVGDCACVKDTSRVCSCAWEEEATRIGGGDDVTSRLRKPTREALLLREVSSALAGMGCGLKGTDVRDVEEFYFRCKGDGIYVLNASSEYNDSVGAGLFGSPAGRELTGAASASSASSSTSGCGSGGWRRRRKKVEEKFASAVANGSSSSAPASSSSSPATRARRCSATGSGACCHHADEDAEKTGEGADDADGSPAASGCERTSGLDALSVASRVFRCVLAAGVRGGGEGSEAPDCSSRLQVRRSSDEIFEEAAALWGLGCQMSDNCRCMDCQSNYFDCDFDCGSEEELAASPPPSPPPTPPPYQWATNAAEATASTPLVEGLYPTLDHHQQPLANGRQASCCLL